MLRNNLGRCSLTATWGTLEQDALRTVGLVLHSCRLSDLVIDVTVGKSEENCILNVSLNLLVTCEVLPRQLILLGVWQENRAALLLQD